MNPQPRRERRKQEVRGRILEAAHDLFEAGGVAGTRVSDICERADVAQAARGFDFHGLFLTADLKRSKEFRDAKTGIQKIRAEINRFLDSYAAHRAFKDMIDPVENRLDWIADHPSGVAEPSHADEAITRRLKDALALVDVRVLDHFVVSAGESVSFAERGLI